MYSMLELTKGHHLTDCVAQESVIETVGSIFAQFVYQLNEVILFKDIQYLIERQVVYYSHLE